ncbi:hypothetical protein NW754_001772 [Fusarium falciforme]|nr:hypothetical protein NW754_001772 [Fusarium falciforme]
MATTTNTGEQAASTSPKLEIAIAGGGIAGLITAIALLKHPQVSVQVYERAPEFKEIGASIALGPNGLRTLEKLGVENALAEGVSQRQESDYPMIYRHWKTEEVIDRDVHKTVTTKKHFTARFHRAHLHQALLENLPQEIIHLNKTTVDVKADPDTGATLYFEDGSTAKADIVIGADGIRSAVRKSFVPNHELHWSGWVALRASFEASRLGDLDFPQDATHWIGHGNTFFHSHLGKGLFTTDAKWDELGSLEQFKDIYKDWNPTIRAFIDAAPYVRLFPNYAGAALDTWSFANRVTLVGDAAHTHGALSAMSGQHPLLTQKSPLRQRLLRSSRIYEATRQPHVNRLLGVVHKNLAGQKANIERAKAETDEQLRQRVSQRMDPSWISEHDVEKAFKQVVEKEEPRAKL